MYCMPIMSTLVRWKLEVQSRRERGGREESEEKCIAQKKSNKKEEKTRGSEVQGYFQIHRSLRPTWAKWYPVSNNDKEEEEGRRSGKKGRRKKERKEGEKEGREGVKNENLKHNFKMRDEGWSGALAVLAENPSSFTSTHIREPTTIYSSRQRGI